MPLTWIIQSTGSTSTNVATRIMGEFPVRVIASIDSFKQLARINRKKLPDIVIADVSESSWTSAQFSNFFNYYAPGSKVVLLVGEQLEHHQDFLQLPTDVDDFTLICALKDLAFHFENEGSTKSNIRYRDLSFDSANFRVHIAGDSDVHSLPMKEAKILKLFLEKPGALITREFIQDAVWEGTKVSPRNIDSHVSRLRRRLEGAEVTIKSIYGGGYILT